MRIADVKTHVLEASLSEPFAWSFNSTNVRTACLVEIVCEDGTVGWGECFGPAALNAAIVRYTLRQIAAHRKGERIEHVVDPKRGY